MATTYLEEEDNDDRNVLKFGPQKGAEITRRQHFSVDQPKKGSSANGDGGDKNAPEDKCGCTYLAFMILGIGLLLPWNAVLQVKQ